MAYSPKDKYEMGLRQAKVDIGQGRGNAMTNAITWALAKGLSLDEALELSDKIFHYSQVQIDKDFESWRELNEHQLKLDTELEVPTVYEDTDINV
jgi:hypothetical protein